MRIPPYYRLPNWQRFLAGVVIGGAISWIIFFFMFGVLQERQIQRIEEQRDDIKKYIDEKTIWQEEITKLNEESKKKMMVQEVIVKITNREKFGIERLSIHETEEKIMKDLQSLLAKDIESVYQNQDLIKKAIENRVFKINDKRYKLEVKEILFFTTVQINLELSLAN